MPSIEVTVESVRVNAQEKARQWVVILQSREQKEHYLFLWIAQPEADAIAFELQGSRFSELSPPTHDLLKNVIETLGAKLKSVEIWDVRENTFYSLLVLDLADQRFYLNARPGDAIALALRARAPIFVAERVMEQAGFVSSEAQKR